MRLRFYILGIFTLSAIAALTGCQRISYTANPARGIYAGTLNTPVVAPVYIRRTVHFLFWGLWPIGEADLDAIAAPVLKPGQVLSNIVVEERNTLVNGIYSFLTYGIYRPRTVTIWGQIHEAPGGQP